MTDRGTAVVLAQALRTLVNSPLPVSLDPTEPFWMACQSARAALALSEPVTGINGEQGPR